MSHYPMTLVTEVRRLHTAGWRVYEIVNILRSKGLQPLPAPNTIRRWIDEDYRCNGLRATAKRKRRQAANAATFSMRGHTDDYQAAFVRCLRADGVSRRDIALVCRRVFDDPTWDLNRVRCVLGEHTRDRGLVAA